MRAVHFMFACCRSLLVETLANKHCALFVHGKYNRVVPNGTHTDVSHGQRCMVRDGTHSAVRRCCRRSKNGLGLGVHECTASAPLPRHLVCHTAGLNSGHFALTPSFPLFTQSLILHILHSHSPVNRYTRKQRLPTHPARTSATKAVDRRIAQLAPRNAPGPPAPD